jgi:hypothetical protein
MLKFVNLIFIKTSILKTTQELVVFNKYTNPKKIKSGSSTKICTKMKSDSNLNQIIFTRMPEAYKEDEKRPQFFTRLVFQRIGRTYTLGEGTGCQFIKTFNYSEFYHEFRFFSLSQPLYQSKKQIYLMIGINKEEVLLNVEFLKFKTQKNEYYLKISERKDNINKINLSSNIRLNLSKISINKFDGIKKFLFFVTLIFMSFLSLF